MISIIEVSPSTGTSPSASAMLTQLSFPTSATGATIKVDFKASDNGIDVVIVVEIDEDVDIVVAIGDTDVDVVVVVVVEGVNVDDRFNLSVIPNTNGLFGGIGANDVAALAIAVVDGSNANGLMISPVDDEGDNDGAADEANESVDGIFELNVIVFEFSVVSPNVTGAKDGNAAGCVEFGVIERVVRFVSCKSIEANVQ